VTRCRARAHARRFRLEARLFGPGCFQPRRRAVEFRRLRCRRAFAGRRLGRGMRWCVS
jgi:hypothetical protein